MLYRIRLSPVCSDKIQNFGEQKLFRWNHYCTTILEMEREMNAEVCIGPDLNVIKIETRKAGWRPFQRFRSSRRAV